MKLSLLLLVAILIFSCESRQPEAPNNALARLETKLAQLEADVNTLNGGQLSQIYCGSCHMFPSPSLLDKSTWKEGVLPNMAFRLGLKTKQGDPYGELSFAEQALLIRSNTYSSKPLIDSVNWMKIVNYFLDHAPDTILINPRTQIPATTDIFKIKTFYADPADYPLTTMVSFDKKLDNIYVGNANNQLHVFNRNGKKKLTQNFKSPPVDILNTTEGTFRLLTMGEMNPSNKRKGIVHLLNQDFQPVKALADSLPRAVDLAQADLTGSGLKDIVVCGFGHNAGTLTWHQNLGEDKFKEHILSNDPGAIKAEIIDANHDGLLDILVLMAQGMERLDLYLNQGSGEFTVETLLSFPPIYGSLYFELADFNNDGHFDILYSNGDNADYSIAPKNYHGIRIFENDGNNVFNETLFHPMFGAIKSMANDFDQDGDLDIAAISFFPEYSIALNESVIYLENQGGNNFTPFKIANNNVGHWLVMETGDVDQDGDEDILLGSFIFGMNIPDSLAIKWKTESNNVMILENRLK